MGKYFGTDGFRGEVNVALTARHAYEIGRYIGRYFSEKCKNAVDSEAFLSGVGEGARARVVIGKDPRRSSYMYEYALSAGLTASGADAYLLHVTTTPSVSYLTRTEGFDCGVMISASHNPYTDNGIKIFDALGEKADEELLDGIEAHLSSVFGCNEGGMSLMNESGVLPYALGLDVGRTVDFAAGRNRYIGFLIALAKVSLREKRIGLDCADGSTFFIAKSVFDALGATTYSIHASPDGSNINRGCGSTRPQALQALVREQGLDMGFAFDGDGDRCICVDENGEIRDGDCILYACALDLKRQNALDGNKIVATVMSNSGLVAALERQGIGVERTRVGDRFVYERMRERNAALGGEQSGHIIFAKHSSTGDGILTAIKLAELCVEREQSFSALFEGLTLYPQTLLNARVKNKRAVLYSPRVQAAAYNAEEKVKAVGGRLLIRPSGTEELIRILTECADEKIASEAAASVLKAVEEEDGR
ncbi:MAG: phosphoglucosamine mutase [Clostridia bacterium]|nr:phosphoglucosamine mutase [Clostridia bacterium]